MVGEILTRGLASCFPERRKLLRSRKQSPDGRKQGLFSRGEAPKGHDPERGMRVLRLGTQTSCRGAGLGRGGAAEWWLDPGACLRRGQQGNLLAFQRQFRRLNWRL